MDPPQVLDFPEIGMEQLINDQDLIMIALSGCRNCHLKRIELGFRVADLFLKVALIRLVVAVLRSEIEAESSSGIQTVVHALLLADIKDRNNVADSTSVVQLVCL